MKRLVAETQFRGHLDPGFEVFHLKRVLFRYQVSFSPSKCKYYTDVCVKNTIEGVVFGHKNARNVYPTVPTNGHRRTGFVDWKGVAGG